MRHLLVLLVVFALAPAASAQLVNGDFENGATGWITTGGACGSVSPSGGNPGGQGVVQFLGLSSGCEGTLSQTFNCGAANGGDCVVSFDWRLEFLGGTGAAVFGVTADGGASWLLTFSSAGLGWQRASVVLPCGPQTLTFGVAAATRTPQDWEFRVDNVTAECLDPVSVENRAWGTLKARYR